MHLSANQPLKTQITVSRPKWDWLVAGFFLAAALIAGFRLVSTQWTDDLFGVTLVALLACGFGLLLGRSALPVWLSTLYAAFYGMFFVPWVLGFIISEPLSGDERLRQLAQRLFTSIGQVSEGNSTTDAILFLFNISVIAWLIGVFSGYRLGRYRDVWNALWPFGFFLLVVQTYDPEIAGRVWYVGAYAALALLLVQRVQLLDHEKNWLKARVHQPQGTNAGLQRLAFEVALVSVFAAWIIPSLPSSLNEANELWARLTSPVENIRKNVERALGPLQGPPSGGGLFGTSLSLGRGSSHTDTVVFSVEPISAETAIKHYYWRDRIYDHYEDGRWSSATTEADKLAAGQSADLVAATGGRTPVIFEITVERPTSLLHVAPQPTQLGIATNVDFNDNPDESLDIAAFWAQNPVEAGESYQMESSVTVATIPELLEAGDDYPDWVIERYLQVPEEITPRTRSLALRLTEDEPNPYEKAEAITEYLRRNIAYRETLPLLPRQAEPIDWMLFQQKQAFCNYYASAEVILLRLAGVPARLAVGYSQGTRAIQLSGRAKYTVRDRDAHAWPEVYFPGIGWVEFEPTANQAAILRPNQPAARLTAGSVLPPSAILNSDETEIILPETAPTLPQPGVEQSERDASFNQPWLNAAAIVAAVLLLFYVSWRRRPGVPIKLSRLIERGFENMNLPTPAAVANWAKWDELPVWARPYMRLNFALRRVNKDLNSGATPHERAKMLAKFLPDMETEISSLTGNYQDRLYGLSDEGAKGSMYGTILRVWFRIEVIAFKQWLAEIFTLLKKKASTFVRKKPRFDGI